MSGFENIDSILRYSLEIENVSSTMVNAKLAEHVWNPVLLSEMVDIDSQPNLSLNGLRINTAILLVV